MGSSVEGTEATETIATTARDSRITRAASPRSRFLERFSDKKLAAVVWEIQRLATTHDPDHARELRKLGRRVGRLERKATKWR